MSALLTVTCTYTDGYVETRTHLWDGWDVDDAAACMRGRRRATGGRRYLVPLTVHHRELGIISEAHEWTDPAQLDLGSIA